METSLTEALAEPTRPVRRGFQVLLGLSSAGANIVLIPVLSVLIPAQVTQIDRVHPANSLAFVLALGAIGALIGNPLAGALSDRTTSPFGRRRPWLLTGMVGAGAGLALLANSHSIPLLAAAWFIVQFFGNILLACYGAVLPDRVPVRQRGTTQAIIGLSAPAAIIISDVMITQVRDVTHAYAPLIAAQVFLTLLFVLLYREAPLPKECQQPFQWKAFLTSFWISPRRYPVFARMWVMWLLAWLAYNLAAGGYFYLYVQNITRYESIFPGRLMSEGMATIQMLQIAIGVPVMFLSGILSDRSGRRKGFVLGGVLLIGVGLLLLTGFSSWAVVLAASIVVGAGFSIFYNMGLALISQLLPSASSRGKDLGVINIASTLPQIVMPPLAAAIVNGLGVASPLGYQVLFLIGASAAAGGILLLHSIRR